jgi:hypothetical protein
MVARIRARGSQKDDRANVRGVCGFQRRWMPVFSGFATRPYHQAGAKRFRSPHKWSVAEFACGRNVVRHAARIAAEAIGTSFGMRW